MALVTKIEKMTLQRNQVHEPVAATYTIFTGLDGARYLKVDTYGSQSRAIKGKKSQSIQLGPDGLAALRKILQSEI